MKKPVCHQNGYAMIVVILLVLMGAVTAIGFLGRSVVWNSMLGVSLDRMTAGFDLESGTGQSRSKLTRAVSAMDLNGKLYHVNGPYYETFNNISNQYATSATNSLTFFQAMVTAQAYNSDGTLISGAEFGNFLTAFPTTWTDQNTSDNEYTEVKYTIDALPPVVAVSPQRITFEYEVNIQTRAYGRQKFTQENGEESVIVSLVIAGAPFSQWAIFMDSMRNQNNGIVTFAGGNTSSQMQEIYDGFVHVNSTPYFYGHPSFLKYFTAVPAEASWVQFDSSDYSPSATFAAEKRGGVDSVSMPTEIFNTLRLAAGDTSSTASTNNTQPSNSDMRGFLAHYAGGDLASNSSAVPDGIYVPVDNQTAKIPTGGIFVQGDAKIVMNVVTGSSDFSSGQWAGIQAADRTCKFQKFAITSLTSGVTPRDVYIGASPCNVTYVFDSSSSASAPVVLAGRLNGNLHVTGKIDELGGASRTRPALAEDFGYTISADKDVRIINDIQYEDVQYYDSTGTTLVANAYGEVNSSGVANTNGSVTPSISIDSQTVLGIISTHRNVYVHLSAPADMNLQAAIYAGNSDYYRSSTGYGCGSNTTGQAGCGFGYEGWNSETGKGNLKLLGGLSEYKSQTLGVLSTPPKGYASHYGYDDRLHGVITPPAYPVSDRPQVTKTIMPYKVWRLSSAAP